MNFNTQLNPWTVIKFGGTSVANLARWQNIETVIQDHLVAGNRPFVVCSAPNGVTNLLDKLLRETLKGNAAEVLKEIENKYLELAQELQINVTDFLKEKFNELKQLADGIHLIGEVSPRVKARLLAFGELMLTRLGAEYLKNAGLNVHWQDARQWMICEKYPDFRHPNAYLAASISAENDSTLQMQINQFAKNTVILTQGFIGQNTENETVLLGRGGSDTSAAYFAAKIAAGSCEIWTDVPGIYTANPKQIPQARLIPELDYDEAQEIASMGATVLHPKSIMPVKKHNIPLYVKFTAEPKRLGTKICVEGFQGTSQIKSILTKNNIVLITIETVQMWHQVGFLAEVFQCFKQHGISIDLISTSESSMTVSLDSNEQFKQSHILDALLHDLNQFAKAKIIAPCASVSLVGRNIRAILHQLGSVFSVFEEQKIYLLSQAANDLNLTFVVDEDQASRLATKLHNLLIEQNPVAQQFGLSWQEEFASLPVNKFAWWHTDRQSLLNLAAQSSPAYVYSAKILKQNVESLKKCNAMDKLFYSIKANNNKDILKLFYEEGLGFECVSIGELEHVLSLFPTIDKQRILFTPNFAAKNEYEKALTLGVRVTIDSVYPFQQWPEIFANQAIFIRVDLGTGSGHHKYVVTGGDQSKFGISLSAISQVKKIAREHSIHILGLHNHSGSGILNPLHWQTVFTEMSALLAELPDIKIFNIGGGLGIVERAGQQPLNLEALNDSLLTIKSKYPAIQLYMEPGRYLVAEAGVLLAKVTQTKYKGEVNFVGVETGMNSLIRPALYGAYHEIVNLTRLDQPKMQCVNIVGPICESGDTLGYSRWLPECHEGDVVLIANVGAYGYSMSSNYNLRKPALEHYLVGE